MTKRVSFKINSIVEFKPEITGQDLDNIGLNLSFKYTTFQVLSRQPRGNFGKAGKDLPYLSVKVRNTNISKPSTWYIPESYLQIKVEDHDQQRKRPTGK